MSDVAVTKAVKSAAPAAPASSPSAKPVVVQTLRAVQPKKLPPSSMYPMGQDCELLAAMVPADMKFEDLLNPVAWGSVCSMVAPNMIAKPDKCAYVIRAFSKDFYVELMVDGVTLNNLGQPNGLRVSCIGPSVDIKTGEARPIDRRTGRALAASEPATVN